MRADAALLVPGARAILALVATFLLAAGGAQAQSLQAKTRESGCTDAPRVVEGSMYKCTTASGASAYFNVPDGSAAAPARRPGGPVVGAPTQPQAAPAGFPRVDANTQKGRDEMRRKVLQDELAAEEKLLLEARAAFSNGAPPALPEEQAQPQRYADRIARLRQSVQLHERNVDALRRELGLPR